MVTEEDFAHHEGDIKPLERRQMLILYGSETGNSEESASDIERMARRLHFKTLLQEMNDADLSDLLRYPLVIFVISTTGQGDLPKNARKFWKSLLRKRLPPNCLHQVNFTTLGLGDSSYLQYNWAARKLHKRLEQLGAVEFLPRGEADERHEDGIDGTVLPWCLTLRAYLEKEHPLPPGLQAIPSDIPLAPKFTIELMNQNPDKKTVEDKPIIGREDAPDPGPTSTYIDSQNRQLDREASLPSHASNHTHTPVSLEDEYQFGDRLRATAHPPSKLAKGRPDGIHALDTTDIIRDGPMENPLDESHGSLEKAPRPSLLPVYDSWLGLVDGNVRLTPKSHWQDVRQLTLRIPARVVPNGKVQPLTYRPGDVAVIYPKNFAQDVQTLIDLMGWGDVADQPFKHVCHNADGPYSTPKNCWPLVNSTLRDLLIDNYDITCIPRRAFFAEIAQYTDDPIHKERLMEFSDPRHSDEFWDYTSRPRRSTLEVLHDFPTVRVPYQRVPSVFPLIRGREYSIASGGGLRFSEKHPGDGDTIVNLLVALVKYKTVLRKTREGLCSRYIASLEPNTPVNITVRSNKVPEAVVDTSKPLLAIAAGTGIAPIRSLIHERKAARFPGDSDAAGTVLFYGGRNRKADFFYEDEWGNMGIEVITAFSRDQPFKVYVQDRLLQNYSVVCSLLRERCGIVLCGSSGKMPEAVRLALYDCMVKGGLAADREQAKAILHRDFVFWEEVW
ncbi:riboflavin synthase domain-like protein [Xylaria sp. CBS 124048]|nr:riboflavin synthase domain-like protein [Xylaria sp. CBS 124048]